LNLVQLAEGIALTLPRLLGFPFAGTSLWQIMFLEHETGEHLVMCIGSVLMGLCFQEI
jgi:hypothetical protein